MKEIWLKIAEHEIGKDSSVTADILSAANGVITVADVLKYFPEFATIDHFKQALCSSLVAVSRQIDEHQVMGQSDEKIFHLRFGAREQSLIEKQHFEFGHILKYGCYL